MSKHNFNATINTEGFKVMNVEGRKVYVKYIPEDNCSILAPMTKSGRWNYGEYFGNWANGKLVAKYPNLTTMDTSVTLYGVQLTKEVLISDTKRDAKGRVALTDEEFDRLLAEAMDELE